MAFSWFPGHMAKGLRQIGEDLRLVDLVLVLLDARIPRSSRHLQIESLLRERGKGFAFVLNKTDLAEADATRAWVRAFESEGIPVVAASALQGKGLGAISKTIAAVRQRVLERAQRKGRVDAPVRLLVAGIPNVGKSSLINRLTASAGGRSAPAKTGKQPGVTRSRQWIALPGGLELRDSPGILFPRIESREMFLHLAATGAIKEDNLPLDEIGEALAALLERRGKLPEGEGETRLARVARQRGMLLPGAVPDVERAAHFLLKQTREAKWGPMTFEHVDDPTPQA
jgi:ribosome biogenesis GTPase A